ncbi:MAG: hypothetical protein KBD52_00710 [Candidatus Pacebacteria bacterium]|nr:hypothetical protein [Candidatus Paceibacterota bacterium]
MSKRNFILLIILLIIILLVLFSIFYTKKPPIETVEDASTDTSFLTNFWPFKKNNPKDSNTENTADISNDGNTTEDTTDTEKLKIIKVSSMPVAGYTAFIKESFINVPIITPDPNTEQTVNNTTPVAPPTEKAVALRYVDRATGNVYQTFAKEINERKITDTLIPRVQESFFADKGESVIMRYLKEDGKTISSFAGKLPSDILGGDASSQKVNGSFLLENIQDISISPDDSQIFYLSNLGDNATGVRANALGINKTQIFSSPFTEWLSSWPNENVITLTTKPSAQVPGYSYVLDPNTKKFSKTLGGINGLTTLTSNDGKLILYSNNNLSLNVYNTETKQNKELNVRTLPEKCVWANDNNVLYCAVPKSVSGGLYPDTWYQGEVSFFDRIWKINIVNSSETIIADPFLVRDGEEIDGIKLSLDENEDYLFFVNKKDSYLWKIELR